MRETLRIIDANSNRAREALRVLDDLARFALDDAGLAQRIKAARHALASAIRSGGAASPLVRLPGARDSAGDVGAPLTAALEGDRPDLHAVAVAAGARLAEALRSIEESLKVIGSDWAAVERIRYQSYELDRNLRLRLPGPRPQWALCVVLAADACPRGDWAAVVRAAVRGGAGAVQLREKSASDARTRERAAQLTRLAEDLRTPGGERPAVIINDRPDIAMLAGADGVHVGQNDLSPAECRAVLGERAIVGVSASSQQQAARAVGAGASYCGLGSMFASATKPKPDIAGPGLLRDYLRDDDTNGTPHLAIGGITPDNIAQLRDAGCRGVAVAGAVCGASDPGAVAKRITAALARDAAG